MLSTTTEFFSSISCCSSSKDSMSSLGGRKARTVLAHLTSGDSTKLSPNSASLLELLLEECSFSASSVARVTITNFPDTIQRTWGIWVLLKRAVLRSGGRAVEWVYFRDKEAMVSVA